MWRLLVCTLSAAVVIAVTTLVLAAASPIAVPPDASCSASLPERLEAGFSPEQLQLFAAILPRPTSSQPIVSAELRAPLHIACQIKPFPHVRAFHEQQLGRSLADFAVKAFAQPPHVVFFDAQREVVRTVPVAPSWTPFELRDRIQTAMSSA